MKPAYLPAIDKQLDKQNDKVLMTNDKLVKPKRSLSIKHWALIIVLGSLVFLSSYYIYRHFVTARASDPARIISEVGKLVVLPADETPTIATVSDLAPLKGQPFFADAEMGDKVLIFQKAKKAILYRPSTKKIIIVAPIK